MSAAATESELVGVHDAQPAGLKAAPKLLRTWHDRADDGEEDNKHLPDTLSHALPSLVRGTLRM